MGLKKVIILSGKYIKSFSVLPGSRILSDRQAFRFYDKQAKNAGFEPTEGIWEKEVSRETLNLFPQLKEIQTGENSLSFSVLSSPGQELSISKILSLKP